MAPSITQGVAYVLTNARGGSAIQISLEDMTTIKGNPFTGLPNQQWKFVPVGGDLYAIQSMLQSRSGRSLYLSLSKSGTLPGGPIEAGPIPISWKVEEAQQGVRISFPNANLSLDLCEGRSAPNTAIGLWHLKPNETAQMWLYTQCSIGIVETSVSSMTSVVDGLPVDLPLKAESRHDICSGPYLLQNVNSGAVLDVAANNDRIVKCFDSHKERNQRWEYVLSGSGITIRSMWTLSRSTDPLYLTVEGPIGEGARVVASPFPVTWEVKRMYSDAQTVSFFWPGTQFVMTGRGKGEDVGFNQSYKDESLLTRSRLC
ncbi:hypothetical protein C8Q76DRAFT_175315 [Earliella scabrosa]|nr:hypothetical protein C8Q76DRAFT_175315 [Earliella scabrosa]